MPTNVGQKPLETLFLDNFAKIFGKLGVFDSKHCQLMHNIAHNIGFLAKTQVFHRKWAENRVHNIEPWLCKRLLQFPGIMVIACAYRTEDPGFESRQGVRS
jgi:hypothetical protein